MTDKKKIDGYWLNMGGLACDALSNVLLPDLTPRRKEIIAEYLGALLDNAYEMGIKMGRAQERYLSATNAIRTTGE